MEHSLKRTEQRRKVKTREYKRFLTNRILNDEGKRLTSGKQKKYPLYQN